MPSRWIAHVDMDSFYVSVERLRAPELVGKPVVVGGLGPRSVVASSSYEARKFGVRSAMPMAQARRLCRDLVIVEPDFHEYSRLSRNVFSELEKIAPVVEQVSVDEAYLDFTGCERLFADREKSARAVKEAVKQVSGLTSTVAVATNKLIAKIGSDFAKPDGLLVVEEGSEAAFLAPLSIRKIPGMGPKTSLIFEQRGILTCSQLAETDTAFIRVHLGDYAVDLQRSARGISTSQVDPFGDRKSLSSEETFDVDIGDIERLKDILRAMAEDIATGLRAERLKARTISVKMRYADFTTCLRAHTIPEPTHIAREIAETAIELLEKNKNPLLKLRLLGLGVRGFQSVNAVTGGQLHFFENPERKVKEEKLEFVKDRLKKKFGKKILGPKV